VNVDSTQPDSEREGGGELEPVGRSRNERLILRVIMVILACLLALTALLIVFETQGTNLRGTPSPQSLQGMTWINSIYGFGPRGDQQLYRPTDAALASAGSIWVVDGQRARLVRFTPGGRVIKVRQFNRGSGRGEAGSLQSAAVDRSGHVYVTDAIRNVVMKLSAGGKFITEWKVTSPGDITVVGDRVFVTQPAGWSVWTRDGKFVATRGAQRGKQGPSMDLPRGILVERDGTTYVSDTGNRQVKAFSRDGRLLWATYGAAGSAPATTPPASGFQVPVGLAMDGKHRLVVVDAFDFSLRILDSKTGRRVGRTYGQPGNGEGQFFYPTNLSYDATRDWFLVADTYNGRVQVIRLPGSGRALSAATRRVPRPWWCCTLPLLGVLLAVLLIRASRRQGEYSRLDEEEGVGEEPPDASANLAES
jgi:DNA-binding beta-propeller fold protein YncE